MLKKEIDYTDFDGNPATETAYFNINRIEGLDLDIEGKQDRAEKLLKEIESLQERGVEPDQATMVRIVKEMVNIFEEILSASYGIRTDDGKRFRKDPAYFQDFQESAFYADWLFDMAKNPEEMGQFIEALVPKNSLPQKQGSPAPRQPQDRQVSQTPQAVTAPQERSDRDIQIENDSNSGMSVFEIAEKHDLRPSEVRKILGA